MFGASAHRDEFVRMLEAGWTSLAVERYAWHRYGEDVPASTIRSYKAKHGIVSRAEAFKSVAPEEFVDVMGARADLIRLQQARIGVDWGHEQNMQKLFGSTRAEISLLAQLLTEHKTDLQDLGLLPKAGQTLTVNDQRMPSQAEELPKHRSLGEAMGAGELDPAVESQLAKVLHLALPRSPAQVDAASGLDVVGR